MRPLYKLPRLYVESPLQARGTFVLAKSQVHHLFNVLRLKTGAQILLFNGQEGEWLAQLVAAGKKEVRVQLEKQVRKQTVAPDLIYCFAPLKSARLDYMVQKATEMGASVLQPVFTCFTQGMQINLERMQANIIEAAQQCGLLSLPTITPPLKLTELLENWLTMPFATQQPRLLIFCDEMLADQQDNALKTLIELAPAPVALLIGPEGGFHDAEREMLHGLPFVRAIGLGKRILRADTAAVAAMALINAVYDDFGHETGFPFHENCFKEKV